MIFKDSCLWRNIIYICEILLKTDVVLQNYWTIWEDYQFSNHHYMALGDLISFAVMFIYFLARSAIIANKYHTTKQEI